MEEITSTVAAVPFRIGNLIQKESTVTTHMEITGLKKLMANTAAALILNPNSSENHTDASPKRQISVSALEAKENQAGVDHVLEMVTDCNSDWNLSRSQSTTKDEFILANNIHCVHNPRSDSATLMANWSDINLPISTINVDDDNVHGKSSLVEQQAEVEPVQDMASAATEHEAEDGSGSDRADPKPSAAFHEMVPKKETSGPSFQNVLEPSGSPLWGASSVCGRREEMEDAIAVKPQLFQVPSLMLMDEATEDQNSPAHFFGVYDGHGGCQVANYCREHLHLVLIEEIEAAVSNLAENSGIDNWQDHWKKAFSNCFHKVDDVVGGVCTLNSASKNDDGSESSVELAPETAGSTAVVAILSQKHIILANCGDSRAVLCRGKEVLPLSTDHKPNREDEWERIEASGGRVIQWNGYRVLGVLAVSRSIGDRYLKPWIIPNPEVTFVQREKNDECLILASDGLWDVMTNEEVCDVARKRILLWHKKNGDSTNKVPTTAQGFGADPAAQYAAECLSKLAIQRGSKDNISVIVVDLKPQRKFKRKA